MGRTLAVVIGLAMSLLVARDALAIPITPVDLDSWARGSLVSRQHIQLFEGDLPPHSLLGRLDSFVFFDGSLYSYVHRVRPFEFDSTLFSTEFSVGGFTGVAGWSFSDARAANGTGTSVDFVLNDFGGQLNWVANWVTPFDGSPGWDFSAIEFFFVSTLPPADFTGDERFTKPYRLVNRAGTDTELSFAPVPEPGSIVLFGSGLAGLYAARRRRRGLTG